MRIDSAVRASEAVNGSLFPGLPRCFECGDVGIVLRDGFPVGCWRKNAGAGHNPPNPAATVLTRTVWSLVKRGVVIQPQHFELAAILTRHSSDRPYQREREMLGHYRPDLSLRSFMGVIEDLRKVWLLPVAGRKEPPAGYWIAADLEDFAEWVSRARRAPLTQLATIHRVARANFPAFADQLELEFREELGRVEVSA